MFYVVPWNLDAEDTLMHLQKFKLIKIVKIYGVQLKITQRPNTINKNWVKA